jgi:hypothetical protein
MDLTHIALLPVLEHTLGVADHRVAIARQPFGMKARYHRRRWRCQSSPKHRRYAVAGQLQWRRVARDDHVLQQRCDRSWRLHLHMKFVSGRTADWRRGQGVETRHRLEVPQLRAWRRIMPGRASEPDEQDPKFCRQRYDHIGFLMWARCFSRELFTIALDIAVSTAFVKQRPSTIARQ